MSPLEDALLTLETKGLLSRLTSLSLGDVKIELSSAERSAPDSNERPERSKADELRRQLKQYLPGAVLPEAE
jgi:hypothetical protein